MTPQKYQTDSATLLVFDNYLIAEAEPHVDVYKNEAHLVQEIAAGHFSGDFGLIENRVNQNSINPQIYQYGKELMPNFVAFALVVYSDAAREISRIEQHCCEEANIQFGLFDSLEKAREWMLETLGKSA